MVEPKGRRQSRGWHNSITDVPGLQVGHWSDPDAATGCTVILTGPDGAMAAGQARGGAPGTRETDLLRPGNLVERVHAVLLTGGSAFGLDAAGGVMRFLEERGIGFGVREIKVPIVVGAVLYDLGIGDPAVRPDSAAGYAACVAATAEPPLLGSVGAGTGATVAKAGGMERLLKGGIGSASVRTGSGQVVAALAAVNATGDVLDPESGRRIAWPRPDEHGYRPHSVEILRLRRRAPPTVPESTTLVLVATSANLSRDELIRVVEMGHAGMARALEPSHSLGDGDIVFALATGIGRRATRTDVAAIGAMGSLVVSRAIVRAVDAAQGLAGVPSAAEFAAGTNSAAKAT